MRLSSRIRQIVPGGDDGWGLYYRARSLAAAGKPVVSLSIGDHDLPPHPGILEAMAESVAAGRTGYAPVEGSDRLRAAIARREPVPTAPEQITVTVGGQAGLFAAMAAALDPGDACILLDPYYATYAQTVRAVGARPILVPCRAEDGFQPDAEAIAAALTPETRAILINTPNNPTGAVYRRARLEALGRLCAERDIVLIADEVYASQVWEGAHVAPRGIPGLAERCLSVGSMSKSHGMTGFRVGWVAGPEDAIARIAELQVTTTYGIAGFIQDAAAHALEAGGEAEAEIRARYRTRRDAALAALGEGPGVRVSPPEGGMYLMLDIRPTGLSGTAFAERLLEEHLIAVMPGESFGRAAAGHVRIALTQPEAVLVPALETVARVAAEAAAQPVS